MWMILCVILIAGTGAAVFAAKYVWAAGSVYPRSAQALDLREKDLTVSEYESLREKLPDCEILWSVPFQGKRIASDTAQLQVASFSREDMEMTDYFPGLTRLDASGCTDYGNLMEFQGRRPQCEVIYQVPVGGQTYPWDAAGLNVEDPSVPELEEKLPYLPMVSSVRLTGTLPDISEIEYLQERFPEIAFSWEVSLGDSLVDGSVRELDLSGGRLDYETVSKLLSWLPRLEKADMRDCGLTDAQLISLAEQYPRCFFLWEMTIGEQRISTDAEEMDISGQEIASAGEIERLLPCFPNLKKVIMCKCGLDDETMDALNRSHEDIRFVWSVRIKGHDIRTDANYFYPYKLDKEMTVNSDDLYPLRYCTDMEAIDIGHMVEVDNCEWAAFMPELKYLIIIETAITDISPLSNCKKLVFLEIFTTNITDYSPLLSCTNLEDLNLGKTYGDPTPIAQMTWLKNVWWQGAAERGKASTGAVEMLTEALPNTHLEFWLMTPNVKNGWRQLDNYYAMRDLMGMYYLK